MTPHRPASPARVGDFGEPLCLELLNPRAGVIEGELNDLDRAQQLNDLNFLNGAPT
jgi:hypothetical protein